MSYQKVKPKKSVKTVRKSNFFNLLQVQLQVTAYSIVFGAAVACFIGLSIADIVRNHCAYLTEKDYSDWTLLKADFYTCALNHWSSEFMSKPIASGNVAFTHFLVWGSFLYRSRVDKTIFWGSVALFFASALAIHYTNAYNENTVVDMNGLMQKPLIQIALNGAHYLVMIVINFYSVYLLLTRGCRKGSKTIVFCCTLFDVLGTYMYSATIETLLNRNTPFWQILVFRYCVHELYWGIVLWGYRVMIRNAIGLRPGGEALFIGRAVCARAIYSRFLLIQLKGFGEIFIINIFDALMALLMRSLYVVYDEWFLNIQYGNRAAKALISTQEESMLRTFEAQADSFASGPSVFLTGALMIFGHFTPIAGQPVDQVKVWLEVIIQIVTNFFVDTVSAPRRATPHVQRTMRDAGCMHTHAFLVPGPTSLSVCLSHARRSPAHALTASLLPLLPLLRL